MGVYFEYKKTLLIKSSGMKMLSGEVINLHFVCVYSHSINVVSCCSFVRHVSSLK